MSYVTGNWAKKGYLGRIRNGNMDAVMDFQFNPTNTTRSRVANYKFAEPPGSPIPTAMFKNIQSDSFTLSLLFDATDSYSEFALGTTAHKAFIESFTQPDFDDFYDDLGQFIPPPQVRYGMGSESWTCVMLDTKFRDVRWNRDMTPTRTWVEITLKTMYVDIAELRARFDFLQSYQDLVLIQEV